MPSSEADASYDGAPEPQGAASGPRPATEPLRPSRTGAVWAAVAAALLLLVLLVIFILQNQAEVDIEFLGWSGAAPVGVALLVAAVASGVLVAAAAAARLLQLRRRVKEDHRIARK